MNEQYVLSRYCAASGSTVLLRTFNSKLEAVQHLLELDSSAYLVSKEDGNLYETDNIDLSYTIHTVEKHKMEEHWVIYRYQPIAQTVNIARLCSSKEEAISWVKEITRTAFKMEESEYKVVFGTKLIDSYWIVEKVPS